MTDLFSQGAGDNPLTAPLPGAAVPLAERMRPAQLDMVVGQEHLTGSNGPLFQMVRIGRPKSMIFWGPPGTGKTTLAQLLADLFDLRFVQLSAIHSGVADLKKAFDEARSALQSGGRPTLLFVDEIHRFNKAQQDGFLPHVENGTIILGGATTENPSFELNAALLSRTQVYVLKSLDEEALDLILTRAEETYLPLPLTPEARSALISNATGDARYLLGQAEVLMDMAEARQSNSAIEPLDVPAMEALLSRRMANHDKAGDQHYNLASALQKSVRGSDPHAALYYAARMVLAGDIAMVYRRLTVYASEEVGIADPMALQTVLAARDVYDRVGFPECGYALAQAVIHVATAPKSNSAHNAWLASMALAKKYPNTSPPKRILNDVTKLMAEQGYRQGYTYDHDAPNAFSGQEFWPDEIGPQRLYEPNPRGHEARVKERLDHWDGLREQRRAGERASKGRKS